MVARNAEYEERFLDEVARTAESKLGVGAQGWPSAVARRLELGQQRYGDLWLSRDLPSEGVEEGLDGGAYAALDAQKLLADPGLVDNAGVSFHLFQAAVHSAAMTWHFQQARRPAIA